MARRNQGCRLEAAAEAPAKVVEAVAETVETVADGKRQGRQAHPRHDRSPREAPGGRREDRRRPPRARPSRATRKTRTAARKTAARGPEKD